MEMKKELSLIAAGLLLLGMGRPGISGAESLSGGRAAWFSSEKQFNQGDLITVIISESAKARQSASTDLHKKTEVGVTTGGLLGGILPSTDVGMNSQHNGGGNLSRQGAMDARITAMVEEVLPGGSLKIKGGQEITFDSGRQLITVEGTIRPRDISSQNEIYSFRIAQARIEYTGRGALHENARTGFLGRFLAWLWIF